MGVLTTAQLRLGAGWGLGPDLTGLSPQGTGMLGLVWLLLLSVPVPVAWAQASAFCLCISGVVHSPVCWGACGSIWSFLGPLPHWSVPAGGGWGKGLVL